MQADVEGDTQLDGLQDHMGSPSSRSAELPRSAAESLRLGSCTLLPKVKAGGVWVVALCTHLHDVPIFLTCLAPQSLKEQYFTSVVSYGHIHRLRKKFVCDKLYIVPNAAVSTEYNAFCRSSICATWPRNGLLST